MALEREGVLSAEQSEVVGARLRSASESEEGRSGRVVSAIGGIGALLLGAGVLYLVAYNWDQLARASKLALIFATWLGLHTAGYRLGRDPGHYPRLGMALSAAGVLAFGGAIALLAQIYNLSAKYPWSVLLWWTLNLPLVLVSGSLLLLLVVTGLFVVWSFWHAGVYLDSLDTLWSHSELLGLPLLSMGLGAFIAALAARSASTRWANFSEPLRWCALLLAIGGVYLLSFRDMLPDADDIASAVEAGEDFRAGLPRVLLPFAIANAAAWLAILVGRKTNGGWRGSDPAVWIAFSGLLFAACFAAWPGGLYLLANFALAATIVLLILGGVREGRSADINSGLSLFILCLITRYFEYLWFRLQAAYAFIGLGLLLLAGGFFLEQRRKLWIARAKGTAP